jgi:hypothetical protein
LQRLGLALPGRGRGAEELKELLAGADREAVGGVGDYVGVDVLLQVEADGGAPWAGPRRVVVGDRRQASGVRVADGHGCGRPARVRGAGQPGSLRRRRERAGDHQPLGVCRAEAGVDSPRQLIKNGEQVVGQCGRHDSILRAVLVKTEQGDR